MRMLTYKDIKIIRFPSKFVADLPPLSSLLFSQGGRRLFFWREGRCRHQDLSVEPRI